MSISYVSYYLILNYYFVNININNIKIYRYHSFQSDQLSPIDVWLVMVKSVMGDG